MPTQAQPNRVSPDDDLRERVNKLFEWTNANLPDMVAQDRLDEVKQSFEGFKGFGLSTSNLLHEAQSGAMVDLLVDNGADVDQPYEDEGMDEEQKPWNYTPLQAAVERGDREVFDRLLAHNADIEIGGDQRPLMIAIGYHPEDYTTGYQPDQDEATMIGMANTLLDNGARVQAEEGEMPVLLAAVQKGHQATLVQRLLEAGADPTQSFEDHGKALHHVSDKQPGLADLLLDYGANVNEPSYDEANDNHETPLEAAMHKGNIKTVERLIERGADAEELVQKPAWSWYSTLNNDPRVKATMEFVRGVATERERATLHQAVAEVEQDTSPEVAEQPAPRRRARL
ncbi:TPA: ankyrin repeat domain-containing protein [Burkholderia vietnamiensis]|nr:ankyrin repeat domain-containing protein [Burkholderia vietnamiensis]